MRAAAVDDANGKTYGLEFSCPGCGRNHIVTTSGADAWTFNGDFAHPTLAPSVLVRSGHYCNPGEQPGDCACDFVERFPDQEPWPWPCARCHSFVRAGRIQFLDDCSHALAGQTMDLQELP